MSTLESRYYDGTYLAENPDWDRADASWKAKLVASILAAHKLEPFTVCEVGCGTGDVLAHLAKSMPNARMTGYDISPQVVPFWNEHAKDGGNLEFHLGDFQEIDRNVYDVLLILDVFEHVRDPFSFLEKSLPHANHFVFHIPLDLSASSVARVSPLMDVRRKVGHLHYYTKDLALATLSDTGYEVIDWRYTGAALHAPNRTLRTRLTRSWSSPLRISKYW
ncbi:MAG: class I SAM-dependent methyltransferase [Sulfuritalea sp.]|nr:class I SAM-dependent methyltransferase [Sulfuritalea sp.]